MPVTDTVGSLRSILSEILGRQCARIAHATGRPVTSDDLARWVPEARRIQAANREADADPRDAEVPQDFWEWGALAIAANLVARERGFRVERLRDVSPYPRAYAEPTLRATRELPEPV